MIQIGDFIAGVGVLGLKAALRTKVRKRYRMLPLAAVLEDSLPGLVCQVQPRILGVTCFQEIDHPKTLSIVVESASP